MAIKTIEYTVDITGISPATEQFAGTKGDHRVTKLNIYVSDALYNEIVDNHSKLFKISKYLLHTRIAYK